MSERGVGPGELFVRLRSPEFRRRIGGYDGVFFERLSRKAIPTARFILPLVQDWIRPRSVADFGCGSGVWLEVWRELGVVDLTGVESEPPLEPASCNWKVGDLTRPLDLGRTVYLVQCLEVGEHLPAIVATLVATLTRHAPVILFSAALPGQGGWQHINERPAAYWRRIVRRTRIRPVRLLATQVERTGAGATLIRPQHLHLCPQGCLAQPPIDGFPIQDRSRAAHNGYQPVLAARGARLRQDLARHLGLPRGSRASDCRSSREPAEVPTGAVGAPQGLAGQWQCGPWLMGRLEDDSRSAGQIVPAGEPVAPPGAGQNMRPSSRP